MASVPQPGDVFPFKKPSESRVPELPHGLMLPPAGSHDAPLSTTKHQTSTDCLTHDVWKKSNITAKHLALSSLVEADFSALHSRKGSTSTPAPGLRRALKNSYSFNVRLVLIYHVYYFYIYSILYGFVVMGSV